MPSIAEELSALRGQWNVIESTISFLANLTQAQIAAANPLRYLLILPVAAYNAAGDTIAIYTTTRVGNVQAPVFNNYFYTPNAFLSYRLTGAMAQVAWYGWVIDSNAPDYPYAANVIEVLAVSG